MFLSNPGWRLQLQFFGVERAVSAGLAVFGRSRALLWPQWQAELESPFIELGAELSE